MSNIGPVGGDVNYTPIQKRLSPAPLPKETSSVTDTIVSKSVINDEFIGKPVVANSALPPKTEKNSNVDNAWFAVKAEATDANVLPLALNMNPGAIKLTESSPQETEFVIAEFMKNTNGSNAAIAATIIDGLA
jgi:hypothetical protein